MANHLDFLVAVDDWIRDSNLTMISDGYQLRQIGAAAGLTNPAHDPVPHWTGLLVHFELMKATRLGGVSVADTPSWTDYEFGCFCNFLITPAGHQEADRTRRKRREDISDSLLSGRPLTAGGYGLAAAHASAIERPLVDLRAALDDGRDQAVISAAKELVEAACKVVLDRSGLSVAKRDSLPALFSRARTAAGIADEPIGRSLAATVQGLAELRNSVGAGHGHLGEPEAAAASRLAAGSATAIAAFLLYRDDPAST